MTTSTTSFYEAYHASPPVIQKIIKLGGAATTIALVTLVVGAIFLLFFSPGTMHVVGMSCLGLSACSGVTPMVIGIYLYFHGTRQKKQSLKQEEQAQDLEDQQNTERTLMSADSQKVQENTKNFQNKLNELKSTLEALGCEDFQVAIRNKGKGWDQGTFSPEKNLDLEIKYKNENQEKLRVGDYLMMEDEDKKTGFMHIIYAHNLGFGYCKIELSNLNSEKKDEIVAQLGLITLWQ